MRRALWAPLDLQVTLRRVADCAERMGDLHTSAEYWYGPPGVPRDGFVSWSKGACACDCFRGDMFAQLGSDMPPKLACSTGHYLARVVNPYNGEVLFADTNF